MIEISAEMVRFAHPLLADAMASMIGPRRRAELHADLARLVADPEQRARHLALAGSAPSAATAVEIATGAHTALERGAPAAAAELLEIAARLTPIEQHEERWRRSIEAARAYKAGGLPALGRSVLENCLAEVQSGVQRADALVALAERALAWFASRDIEGRRLITDGAWSYARTRDLRHLLQQLQIRHIITPPYTPRWNGKVERGHQTMEREWAKGVRHANSTARNQALPHWLRYYNERRPHSSLGNRPPISRAHNLSGQDN